MLAELEVERVFNSQMHVDTAPPASKNCIISPLHLKASQNETVAADCASSQHVASTNGVTQQLLCEPNQQEKPYGVLVSEATQTEERTIGIDISVQTASQEMDDKNVGDSHATQTDEVPTNESAVQVDIDKVTMATVAPPPVGFTSAATQTNANTVELEASVFSKLSANVEGWIARQEAGQMSEAARDVLAYNLKELKGRIELAENSLIWLSILSKLSSVERNL